MVDNEHYTFGDTDLAAERLRLLARVFEPSSARILGWFSDLTGDVALDLGCGPGHTTRLLARHAGGAGRVIGLDQSTRLLEVAAREPPDPRVSFAECDVTMSPFPAPAASILYSRFLLTHLREPDQVVRGWADAAIPGARLVLEETAFMTAEDPIFSRYYALVERMQAHYGQRMYIGRELAELARSVGPDWAVEHAEIAVSPLPAVQMARLHLQNLRTWSQDPFAKAQYRATELDVLAAELAALAAEAVSTASVSLGMGQVVLRRR